MPSVEPPLADVTYYEIVKWLHLLSVVAAWGVTFTFPVWASLAESRYPRALPYYHEASERIGAVVVGGGTMVTLVTGILLVLEGPWGFSDLFVTWGFAATIVLVVLGLAFFTPRGKHQRDIIERDISAAGAGEVKISDRYRGLGRQVTIVGIVNSIIVALTIYVMTAKPYQ